MKEYGKIIVTGAVVGIIAVILTVMGNPGNMGFCIACFLRDMAGSVKLHTAPIVQYFRPEIVGLVVGAFGASIAFKEFKPSGGSSPITRFILGFIVMVGALMFLGCPLRMMLRIGGGDLNAVIGLVGFVVGILAGIFVLNKGFSLKRAYTLEKPEGVAFTGIMVFMFILFIMVPSLFVFSESGPGSMRAPVLIALIAGLIVGILAQRTRLCMVGGIRDAVMFQDFYLISGFIAIAVFAFIGNAVAGKLMIGFAGQPVAHTDGLWNFLGMALAGWASILLGGCPLRQLILAGSGNSDSAVSVLGMIVGAAFCHNFGLASSTDGPSANGQMAVIIGFIVVVIISVLNIKRRGNE